MVFWTHEYICNLCSVTTFEAPEMNTKQDTSSSNYLHTRGPYSHIVVIQVGQNSTISDRIGINPVELSGMCFCCDITRGWFPAVCLNHSQLTQNNPRMESSHWQSRVSFLLERTRFCAIWYFLLELNNGNAQHNGFCVGLSYIILCNVQGLPKPFYYYFYCY